jgi:hypothetical protein
LWKGSGLNHPFITDKDSGIVVAVVVEGPVAELADCEKNLP